MSHNVEAYKLEEIFKYILFEAKLYFRLKNWKNEILAYVFEILILIWLKLRFAVSLSVVFK